MNALLTEQDIEALTGAKKGAKQGEVLDRHGIYYIKRLDGTITTTWHHVNHPAQQKVYSIDEPDFGAIANG